MQMSVVTTESLIALELYCQELGGKLAEVQAELATAKKSLADSEASQADAIREATAQNGNSWPDDKVGTIVKLQQDIDRRASRISGLDNQKKKHTAEIGRAGELIHRKIRDAAEGAGLYDAKEEPGTAWRAVELSHIADEELAKEFAGQGLVSVGEVNDAVVDGRIEELIGKGLKKSSVNRLIIRVVHYIKARGLQPAGAMAEIAGKKEAVEPEPEPGTGPGSDLVDERAMDPAPDRATVSVTISGFIKELHAFLEVQGDDPVKARQLLGGDDSARDKTAELIAEALTAAPDEVAIERIKHFRTYGPNAWAAMFGTEARAMLDAALVASPHGKAKRGKGASAAVPA